MCVGGGGGVKAHKKSDQRIFKFSTYFTEGVFLQRPQSPRGIQLLIPWHTGILEFSRGGGGRLVLIPMEPYSICDFPVNGVRTPAPPPLSVSAHVRDVSLVALSLIINLREETQLN